MLNVVVTEASGLEAKDANGYSDPYCMLGIRPAPPQQVRQNILVRYLRVLINKFIKFFEGRKH